MALFGGDNSAGLLFRIKGDSSEAVKAIKDVQREQQALTTESKALGSSLLTTNNVAALSVAALASIATAAVAAASAMVSLSRQAASYGSAIKDASDKTGLSAKSISALKYAAEQGGSSFEKIEGSIAKFNVKLGEANLGNEKAIETFRRYGITAQDTEGAIRQAIEAINDMESADQKAAAAKALFGDRTGDIIPVIEGMNGSLDDAIERTKALGIIIDDRTAAAAKRLDDAFLDLTLVTKGVSLQIGNELIPAMERLITSTVNWLVRNQDLIRVLAELVGTWLERFVNMLIVVSRGLETVANAVTRADGAFGKFTNTVLTALPALRLYLMLLEGIHATAARIAGGDQARGQAGGSISPALLNLGSGRTLTGGGGGGGGRSRANDEAEQRQRRELQAQLDLQRLYLDRLEKEYKTTVDNLLAEFKRTGDDVSLAEGINAAITETETKYRELVTTISDLEKRLLADRTAGEQELARERRNARSEDFARSVNDAKERVNKTLGEFDDKIADATKKIFDQLKKDASEAMDDLEAELLSSNIRFTENAINELQAIIRNPQVSRALRQQAADDLISAVGALAEFLEQSALQQRNRRQDALDAEKAARLKNIQDTIRDEERRLQAIEELNILFKQRGELLEAEYQRRLAEIRENAAGTAAGADLGTGGSGSFFEEFTKTIQIESINAMVEAFTKLGEAVGSVVEAFVLYASAGANFRQVTAQIIAAIAKQATVQAVFEFAQGLAKLAMAFFGIPNAGPSATAHFAASAAFASIAGVTAAIGRGVAGNSFQRESGRATGGAGSGQGEEQNNNFGGRFSGFGNGQGVSGSPFNGLRIYLERTNQVLGKLDETVEGFTARVRTLPPEEVITMGAPRAKNAIFDAIESEMSSDLRAGDRFRRVSGEAF